MCPIEHGVAANLAQEAVYGTPLPTNGRLLRNLVGGGELHPVAHPAFLHAVGGGLRRCHRGARLHRQGCGAELPQGLGADGTRPARTTSRPRRSCRATPPSTSPTPSSTSARCATMSRPSRCAPRRRELGALFGGKLPHAAEPVPRRRRPTGEDRHDRRGDEDHHPPAALHRPPLRAGRARGGRGDAAVLLSSAAGLGTSSPSACSTRTTPRRQRCSLPGR